VSSRVRIVLIATAFNLLFESSLRGLNNLAAQPFLPVFLFVVYSSLFLIEEELIRRFRLRDSHLVLLAFVYGSVYLCLVSGAAFVRPTALGVNWSAVLFVIVVWWGVLQSIVTSYAANRLAPRNWNEPPLSAGGLGFAVAINLTCVGILQASGRIPVGGPIGYLTMVILGVAGLLAFVWSTRRRSASSGEFEKSTFLDVLVIVSVAVFAYSAAFARGGTELAAEATVFNSQALRIVTGWTTILAASVFVYRLLRRKPIPV
jgi:hypothetical protein